MGNNMGGTSSKAAKVMKINGELLKIKAPTKVFEIIKEYPSHVLLDSEEFLRFNLRAKPLDPQFELKPKKLYLLVELPKFPRGTLRRVRSGVVEPTTPTKDYVRKMTKRSVSDVSSIMTRSTAGSDSDESGSLESHSDSPVVVGPTRVKMRVPKVMVEKIVAESRDEGEVAEKIVRLCLEDNAAVKGGGAPPPQVVEEHGGEEIEMSGDDVDVVERHRFNLLCSPCSSLYHKRKYKKLTS